MNSNNTTTTKAIAKPVIKLIAVGAFGGLLTSLGGFELLAFLEVTAILYALLTLMIMMYKPIFKFIGLPIVSLLVMCLGIGLVSMLLSFAGQVLPNFLQAILAVIMIGSAFVYDGLKIKRAFELSDDEDSYNEV